MLRQLVYCENRPHYVVPCIKKKTSDKNVLKTLPCKKEAEITSEYLLDF